MGSGDVGSQIVISNVRVFHDIATGAHQLMRDHLTSGRRPKPDGSSGWILTYDPEQKSFKNALVTIIFVGVCLEAALHLLIVQRHGIKAYRTHDKQPYEEKLRLLGCDDPEIMDLCVRYRKVRREVVHEKAHLDRGEIRTAQDEADVAIALLERVFAHFGL